MQGGGVIASEVLVRQTSHGFCHQRWVTVLLGLGVFTVVANIKGLRLGRRLHKLSMTQSTKSIGVEDSPSVQEASSAADITPKNWEFRHQ